MKQFLALLLVLVMAGSLAACGEKAPETTAPAIPAQEKTEAQPAPAEKAEKPETEAVAENQPEEAAPAEQDEANRKEIAISLINQDVSALYEVLGEPLSAEYTKSCNGPGDDGMLTYEDFIVFTYRENGVETVFDVL